MLQIICIITTILFTVEFIYRNIIQIIRRRKFTQLIAADNNFFGLYAYIFTFAVTFITALGLFSESDTEEFPFGLYISFAVLHFIFIFVCPKTIYFSNEGFETGYFRLHLTTYKAVTSVMFSPCHTPFEGHKETTVVHFEVNYKGYKARINNMQVPLVRTWFDLDREKDDIAESSQTLASSKRNAGVSKKTNKKIISTLSITVAIAGFCFVIGIIGLLINPTNVYNSLVNKGPVVSSEIERTPLDAISTVKTDSENNLYVFYERTNEVNVYDCDGNFQYSVIAPRRGSRGANGIEIHNGSLYVINKENDIFHFKNGKLIKSYIYEKDYDYKIYDRYKLYSYFDSVEEPETHVIHSASGEEVIYNNSLQVYTVKNGEKNYIVHRNFFINFFNADFMFIFNAIMLIITFLGDYIINRLKKKDL